MSEERKIEPRYQAQGKQLVDTLFDLGLLSESLSRDGIDGIEDLTALHFQQIATSSTKCAGFAKKYKILGGRLKKDDDDLRDLHAEEMRWIARAREAEHEVLKQRVEILAQQEEIERLRKLFAREEKADVAWAWSRDVGAFLKQALEPPWGLSGRERYMEACRLFTTAVELGVIPEPDCGPGEIQPEHPYVSPCRCNPESKFSYPGCIIQKCAKCGGYKVSRS